MEVNVNKGRIAVASIEISFTWKNFERKENGEREEWIDTFRRKFAKDEVAQS